MGNLGLAAAEVAFFSPAFVISLVVVVRQGFSRQLGWLYLVLLSIVRLVGASITLYIETQHDYSTSLIIAAAVCSAIGTSPLLLALLGFLQRVNAGMDGPGSLHPLFFRPVALIALAALVLAIIGGTDEDSASSMKVGKSLMEAGALLFLAVLVIEGAITILFFFRINSVQPTERKLVYAGTAALPFLVVRIAYSVAVSFAEPGSDFYYAALDVYVQAFMQFLMEAIVVSLFVVAGMLTPKMPKPEVGQDDIEGQQLKSHSHAARHERRSGRNGKAQRNLGDYRPSRLIMNAINDRR